MQNLIPHFIRKYIGTFANLADLANVAGSAMRITVGATVGAACAFIISIGCIAAPRPLSAAEDISISFSANQTAAFNIGEEFPVWVTVETNGKSINAIEGKIFISDNIELMGLQTGESIITSWIERPGIGLPVTFSGIMTSGFDGLIKVGSFPKKLPGNILTLMLKAKAAGEAYIEIQNARILLNDGKGTEAQMSAVPFTFQISSSIGNTRAEYADTEPIIISTEIMQDPGIADGNYVLVFQAEDKGSGIRHIEIKEGRGDWQRAESPYTIADQTLRSDIYVKAINFAGKETISKVDLPNAEQREMMKYALIIIALTAILLIGTYLEKRKNSIG